MTAQNSLSDNIKAQMRKGILEYCILSILSRTDAYASEIIAELRQSQMIVVEGTLYPLLTRQKKRRIARVSLGGVASGASRKYYRITEHGRHVLAQLDAAWNELVEQINNIRATDSLHQTLGCRSVEDKTPLKTEY